MSDKQVGLLWKYAGNRENTDKPPLYGMHPHTPLFYKINWVYKALEWARVLHSNPRTEKALQYSVYNLRDMASLAGITATHNLMALLSFTLLLIGAANGGAEVTMSSG